MFKNIIKRLKSRRGNSLAEFAVTTAMMATLATTAAPKFGQIGAGAKEKKTIANIDKIITVANNFYNQTLSEEGKGRFPGQSKYDQPVGGVNLSEGQLTDEALEITPKSCRLRKAILDPHERKRSEKSGAAA